MAEQGKEKPGTPKTEEAERASEMMAPPPPPRMRQPAKTGWRSSTG